MEKKTNTFNYFIVVLIILVIAFLGITYAYWNVTINQENKNVVKSVCLKVSMAKDENEISLPKAMPISDEEGVALEPYTFSIKNTCNDNASFQINLESLSKISGTEEIPEENRLAPKYVRFKLNEVTKPEDGTMLLLSNTDEVTPILDNTYSSHKLMTGYLSPSETKDFELRLWIDKDADEGAILKTFASKVTITNAYLEEDKIPPTADLDLAVCDMTITAKGTSDKEVSKYEYKIDDGNWQVNSNAQKEITVEEKGLHTVGFRVIDSKGNVSNEVIKEIEVKDELANIYGKEIPVITCGTNKNGLYKVEHKDETELIEDGWKKDEYRFAGVNYKDDSTSYVHNYVKFNDEKWRIIGLVNVKLGDGTYGQRLKIVRTDGVGSQKDFGSYYWANSTNNWTTSKLKTMLNGIYYNSTSGSCYTNSNIATQCNFTGSGTLPKGLSETAQGMVDDTVTWTLGGINAVTTTTVTQFYNYERGTTVYNNQPTEWTASDDTTEHNGVGLIYTSDYGYASHGGSKGREECFKKELSSWGENAQTECANNDWLKSSSTIWTITPHSGLSNRAFYVGSAGFVVNNYAFFFSNVVWPVVYLKDSVQIVDGDGSLTNPYNLKIN